MKFKGNGGIATWHSMVRNAYLIMCLLDGNLNAVMVPAMLIFVERGCRAERTAGAKALR